MLEKELLTLCKNRDSFAFDELVKRNKNYILSWILSKEPNKHRAEDIYQRTLIKSWRAIEKFKGNSSYCTWANTIARNLFIDDYNKRLKSKEVSFSDLGTGPRKGAHVAPAFVMPRNEIDSSPTPLERICDRERKIETETLLFGLSKPHRIILKFYYSDQLSYKEIAAEMSCSIGTVMSRLFYAKRNALKIIKTKKNLERILT